MFNGKGEVLIVYYLQKGSQIMPPQFTHVHGSSVEFPAMVGTHNMLISQRERQESFLLELLPFGRL